MMDKLAGALALFYFATAGVALVYVGVHLIGTSYGVPILDVLRWPMAGVILALGVFSLVVLIREVLPN